MYDRKISIPTKQCLGPVRQNARPATPSYPELSAILQKNIQQVLLGQASAEEGMKAAAEAAARLR